MPETHVDRYATYECDGWMVRNLHEFGNCYIPDDIISLFHGNTEVLRLVLEFASHRHIRLRKRPIGFIAEVSE